MGSEREYVLKWHSFSSTIQGVFRRLLENSAFADVTLAVDNETLLCHRLVLSACSTYFETLLTNHPHTHPIIILLDIPHTVVAALVKFMYSGEIRLPQDQLQCFLKAAETLRIKGLTETEGVAGDRVLESSQPPPLIPATPSAASTPVVTSIPVTRPSTGWIAPTPAFKRRSPEPAHYESAPAPAHELSSAKRRKSRAAAQPVHAVQVKPELMPEMEVESDPEHEPLSLTINEEPIKEETGEELQEVREEAGKIEVVNQATLNGGPELKEEPALSEHQDPEEADEEDLEEEAERAAEEEEEATQRRRLEEDIELVSGDTTEDGQPESPPDAEQQPSTSAAPHSSAAPTTMQSVSEAAASTLMSSCGGDNLPWRDPRWTNLLPEEKVMEAMGNMLDVPTLAAKLMKNLFTEEERINSNTTGDHGKQIFDKEKMDLIKSIVFHVSKISEEDQFGRDDLWVRCKMKIDKWNRDLRYARKKKDKDTSLPTMVKLEYSGPGREDEWEPQREELSLALAPRWLEGTSYGIRSPPVAPQCSADV